MKHCASKDVVRNIQLNLRIHTAHVIDFLSSKRVDLIIGGTIILDTNNMTTSVHLKQLIHKLDKTI